ncbi:MAG: PH domain-containing protein [Candidatus Buchananbacteria bacterium]|nr:PH domain-containing protein [Candidatus Buchananbacteria bacterium]
MISKNSLPDQHVGEEVVLHLRRHWFIFLKIFLFVVILALIPMALYYMISQNIPTIIESDIGYPLLLVLFLSYYLILLVAILTVWTENYLDVWTITTDRIINREQNSLFNRIVSELELKMVQDVTAEQKGFFPTVFYYGDVYIQSAGEKERFVFEQIPQPYKIAKIIQQLDEKAKKNSPERI